MGDRFYLQLACAGCGTKNPSDEEYQDDPLGNGIYYAESSGSMSFTCGSCRKINWISTGYTTRVVTKEEEKKLYEDNGFEEV